MFSRLSIRAKVTAVVSLLLVAIAGMGLLAITKMRAMNGNTVQIATNWLPSIRVLGELRTGVVSYRNVLREHMLSETLEQKEAAEKTLQGVVESNEKIRQSYEAMITSPEERALYDEWAKSWTAYKEGAARVMELSRKEAGKVPLEAHALNKNVVNKLSMAADEILKKDIELNNKGAVDETQTAANSYDSAFWLVLVILGAGVLVGVAVSFVVVRDVMGGIASIVLPMQALGAGDLKAEVPHRGERTEIGTMADALQIFKEALIAKRAADEAAARDAEAKIERARRVDAITRDFESLIGEVVQTVSSASTQTGGFRHDAVLHRRPLTGACDRGRSRFRGSLHQRAVGGVRDRGIVLLGQRDQPPGAGIGAGGRRSCRSGAFHDRTCQRVVEDRDPHR